MDQPDVPEENPIPESHLRLVEERLRRHHADPSRARPLSEFLKKLDEKLDGALDERTGCVEPQLDRLAETPEEIPIPESHLRLIESRWRGGLRSSGLRPDRTATGPSRIPMKRERDRCRVGDPNYLRRLGEPTYVKRGIPP